MTTQLKAGSVQRKLFWISKDNEHSRKLPVYIKCYRNKDNRTYTQPQCTMEGIFPTMFYVGQHPSFCKTFFHGSFNNSGFFYSTLNDLVE